jgi:hypothetical protein
MGVQMLLVRIVHFLIGAVLAGGGGYLVWTQRDASRAIFPPGAEGVSWLLLAGLLGALAGLVFLISAVAPRPNRKARLAAEAERRKETIQAADTYYSERARAADRDWRSGELPPATPPPPKSEPAPAPPAPEAPLAAQSAPLPDPGPRAASMKPVAAAAPPEAPAPNPFPSAATLAPIPKAAEAPPAPGPAQPAPSNVVSLGGGASFAAIRAAIAEGRLDDADKMLNAEREGAKGEALAELTGLAGDHAAAAGRQSNAKWLWRLALKRFGEADAMNSPAARTVSERLRLSDN